MPELTKPERFDVGPCPNKGEVGYCNGEVNDVLCPLKAAFFGIVASYGGWKESEARGEGESCPTRVDWALPYKGKNELIVLTDGGVLPGMRKGERGPCIYQVMASTNPAALDKVREAFSRIPEGRENVIKYLQETLGASNDVGNRALAMASEHQPALERLKVR